MKKLDFIRLMGNIDEKYVSESERYSARPKNFIKVTALAACLAIIVTAIPAALILNREYNKDGHSHSITSDDPIIKNYENIKLENGSLLLNTIQLSNGKIISNMENSHPYVYDYEPLDTDKAHEEMIKSALKYHEERYSSYPYTVTSIGNVNYDIIVSDENVTKSIYSNNTGVYDEYGGDSSRFLWDGSIYKPNEMTGEEMYDFLSTEIEKLNKVFGCNFDSYYFYNAKMIETQLLLWDSNNKEINDQIEQLDKNMFNESDGYAEDYLEFRNLALTIVLPCRSKDPYTKPYVTYNKEYYQPLENEQFVSKIDYLSLNIGGKYFRSTSSNEDLWDCALQLEQYLIDVFKISGLTDQYEVRYTEFKPNQNPNDILAQKNVIVNLKPSEEQKNGTVSFIFETLDGNEYFLTKVNNNYTLAQENYIELIDKEKAIENLALGYCIGDIGLGCRVCRDDYLKDVMENIEKNVKCELVIVPDIIFVSDDQSVVYEFPVYAFTVPTENEGEYHVAYVLAATGGKLFNIDIEKLNMNLYSRAMAECPNCDDHVNIATKKNERIDNMIEEMLKDVSSDRKKVVRSQLRKRYAW